MSRYVVPFDALNTVDAPPYVDLTDLEYAILQATHGHSLSTVAIAEHVGLGNDPTRVVPVLEHLEHLNLLDGYYAAGRTTASLTETHRRYYRSTERGRLVVAATV